MNSEIRASHVLASVGASSGSADLSFQNPLFSVGSDNAFPQVLKEQVSARREPARSQDTSSAQRERRDAAVRQDEQARDRQAGGKELPARADRADATREKSRSSTERADSAADQRQKPDAADTAAAAPAAEDAAVPTGPDSDQANVSDQQSDADESLSSEAQALAAVGVQTDHPAMVDAVTEASVGVGDTVTQPDTVSAEDGAAVAVVTTDSASGDSLAGGDAVGEPLPETLMSQPAGDVDADQLVQATTEAVAEGAESLDEAPAVSAMSSTRTAGAEGPAAATMQSVSVAQPGVTVSAEPAAAAASAVSAEPARKVAELVADLRQFADGETKGNADSQSAESGELGPEVSRAEKNAEARAELSRQQLAAGGERQQGIRDQLAALVQQVTGAADQAQKKAEKSKTDAVTDSKPTVFSRTLEQFSAARTEPGKPVSTGIQTPVGQREWAGELGQRLVMMVSSKLKSAEIHLNPKELGPVEVRIRMHEDKAHVVFSSQVAQTRDALEQAVPRLREMLDQNGVALGNVDVRDQGAQHSHAQDQFGRNQQGRNGGAEVAETDAEATPAPVRMVGLVDYYA